MHSFRSFANSPFRPWFSCSNRQSLIFAIVLLSFNAWIAPTEASERAGTIPGEFAVSPTGEAIYDMPIQAPASTGGLRPDVSLRYRHRGGSGIAGQGWTVGGLSGISRCPQTLAQDGQIRQVQYDPNDRFCLDGQRLVLVSGTYGANGAYYRTEIESFRQIRSYGIQGSGPQYFVVWDRDGTRHWYGHSWGSSLQDAASGSYVNWVRRLTRDRFDNDIRYYYTADNTAGEQILDRIDYAVNSGQALDARYRLRFTYQTRPASDQRSGYRYGLLWSRTKRLHQIHVEHSPYGTGTFDTVYQYDLEYTTGTTGRSQLISVKQRLEDDYLTPTTITWHNSVAGWNSHLSSGLSSSGHANTLVGDFNGDGQQDLFVTTNGEWHIVLAGNGSFTNIIDTNRSAPNAAYTMAVDFNGDAKTDLLVPHSDGKWHVYLSTGTGFSDINTQESTAGYQLSYAEDVDGDGRGDLVYASGDKLYLRKSTGSDLSSTPLLVYTMQPTGDYRNIEAVRGRPAHSLDRQVDFNGDGMGDLMILEREIEQDDYGYNEWHNWTALVFNGNDFDVLSGIAPSSSADPRLVDINGDALTDIVYTVGSNWHLMLSLGASLSPAVSLGISDSYSASTVFADYDADGREDLLRATGSNWLVHTSLGTSFATSGVSVGGPSPTITPIVPMDVSGSGHNDLVLSYSNYWYVRKHKSSSVDVVKKITNGLGNYYTPTYQSLATTTAYQQIAHGTPPVTQDYRQPIYVVTRHTSRSGVGSGSFYIDYRYYDGLMSLQGRGFLGFGQVRQYDYREGTRYSRQFYRQDFPYIGRLGLSLIEQSDWKDIRRVDPTWISSSQYSGVYFVRRDKTETRWHEVGGALNGSEIRRIVDDYAYETSYGNLTARTTTTTSPQAPGDVYTTSLNYLYANYTSPWCLGLPTQIEVTRSAPGATTQTRRTNNTYNSSNCRLLTSTDTSIGDSNLQLKTTLTYDAYGNVASLTQDSANGAAADRKTTYSYDAWGHLPVSETQVVDSAPDATRNFDWDYYLNVPNLTTDIGGLTTSWGFDAFGRITAVSRPDGTRTNWYYIACAGCGSTSGRYYIRRVDTSGFESRDYRDWYGRTIRTTSDLPTGQSRKTTIYYDKLGRIVKDYAPSIPGITPVHYTVYAYDLIGRIVSEDRPSDETQVTGGALTSVSYEGLTTTVVNPANQTTTYLSDPIGRVERVTDDLGGQINYQYTAFDQLAKVWDPASNLTTISYNARGDKIAMTSPDLGSWSYAWSVFGEQISQIDGKNQSVTSAFNQLGLPTIRSEPEGVTIWTYHATTGAALWQLATVSGPGGFSEAYSYDSLGRTSGITTTISGTAYTTNLAYHTTGSGKGRLQRITYPVSTSGFRFKADYDYDAQGFLSNVKNGDTPAIVYYELNETDAFGQEMLASLGNGLTEDRDYDTATGRLKTIKTGPTLSATVQNLNYHWDLIGNLTSREDVNQSKTEVFSYDDLNRLKTAHLNGALTLSVNYDATGRITYKSDVGTYTYGAGSAGPGAVTSITGIRHGTYSYDVNGNMSQRDGDAITWYSYNKPNRINYGSDYAQFSYGPTRARFKQTAVNSGITTTTYYVGAHFEKETKSGVTEYRHNIFAGNRAVAVYTRPTSGSITTRYLHRDHLGSVVSVTDESGAVDQTFSYDAFGKRRYPNWSADPTDSQFNALHATERGYTGHEHIDNVRLVHMNGRAQDPIIGRMVSADPLVPDPVSSQAFNRYAYVYNNPMTFVDPSGFDPQGDEDRLTRSEFCRLFGGCQGYWNPPGSITDQDIDSLDRREDYYDCVYAGLCQGERSRDDDSQDDTTRSIFSDVNIDWRFVTSVAWEIAGWGLIGVDVANTMVSPGPDVGILGATFISGARTLRSGVPNGGSIWQSSRLDAAKFEHIFSRKHLQGGVLDLGDSPQDVLNRVRDNVLRADMQGLLKQGDNTIRTTINGQRATIRANFDGNELRSLDVFKGTTARDLGNVIDLP